MAYPVIGFVGFGEAARCFAAHLASRGTTGMVAFCDGKSNRPPYSASFRQTAAASGVTLVDNLAELMDQAEIVFSAVVVATAAAVGESIAARLRSGMLVLLVNRPVPQPPSRCCAAW